MCSTGFLRLYIRGENCSFISLWKIKFRFSVSWIWGRTTGNKKSPALRYFTTLELVVRINRKGSEGTYALQASRKYSLASVKSNSIKIHGSLHES